MRMQKRGRFDANFIMSSGDEKNMEEEETEKDRERYSKTNESNLSELGKRKKKNSINLG